MLSLLFLHNFFLMKISISICCNEIIIHGHVLFQSKASYTDIFFIIYEKYQSSNFSFMNLIIFRTLYWISNRNGQYSIDGGSFDGMKRWKIAEKAIIQNPSGLFYDYSYKKYVQILVWNGDNIFYKVCSLIIEHPVFYLQTILHW